MGNMWGRAKHHLKLDTQIKSRKSGRVVGGLGHHYGGGSGCSYEDLKITLTEQVEKKTMEYLAERELFWQHQLRVYVQNGCKAHCYRKDFG